MTVTLVLTRLQCTLGPGMHVNAHALNDTHRLLTDLMTGYDRHVRPVRNQAHPVRVYIDFSLHSVKENVI